MEAKTVSTTTFREAASEFSRQLEVPRRVQAHPYGALAAAAGLGYVLGGGLFTRLTARLLRVGVRVGAELAAVPCLVRAAEAFTTERKKRGS